MISDLSCGDAGKGGAKAAGLRAGQGPRPLAGDMGLGCVSKVCRNVQQSGPHPTLALHLRSDSSVEGV